MFLSIRRKAMKEEALKSIVIDVYTGEKIPRVIWANDETGRYRQYLTDENGKILVKHQGDIEVFKRKRDGAIVGFGPKAVPVSKIFTGNIKIVKKAEFESTTKRHIR